MKWILIATLIGVIMLIAYGLSEQYKERFDFYQYGMAQYETAGMKLTSYGAVSMEQGPDLSENEVQDDSLQMGGCACQMM